MEKKSWNFAGQVQIGIEKEQLSWQTANGQSGSLPLQSIERVDYEEGGLLRLTAMPNHPLIVVPDTPDSQLLAAEIQAYMQDLHMLSIAASEAADTSMTPSSLAVNELAKLEHLKTVGFLTEEEFQQMKSRLQLS